MRVGRPWRLGELAVGPLRAPVGRYGWAGRAPPRAGRRCSRRAPSKAAAEGRQRQPRCRRSPRGDVVEQLLARLAAVVGHGLPRPRGGAGPPCRVCARARQGPRRRPGRGVDVRVLRDHAAERELGLLLAHRGGDGCCRWSWGQKKNFWTFAARSGGISSGRIDRQARRARSRASGRRSAHWRVSYTGSPCARLLNAPGSSYGFGRLVRSGADRPRGSRGSSGCVVRR